MRLLSQADVLKFSNKFSDIESSTQALLLVLTISTHSYQGRKNKNKIINQLEVNCNHQKKIVIKHPSIYHRKQVSMPTPIQILYSAVVRQWWWWSGRCSVACAWWVARSQHHHTPAPRDVLNTHK